jgi:hypothetical protein
LRANFTNNEIVIRHAGVLIAGFGSVCHPSLIQVNGLGVTERLQMDKIYRVRITNWKDGKDEYFFQYESDAEMFANKYKHFGYTPIMETIFMQELGVRI